MFENCVKLYYSNQECHYWLAVISKANGDMSSFFKEKLIAKKISMRIIDEGIPSYIKDKEEILDYESEIRVAKSTIKKLDMLDD